MVKTNPISLLFLLSLVVAVVLGQDEGAAVGHEEAAAVPPSCSCDEISQAHDKCVNDWRILDALRQTLEQQVRDTETQANERCTAQIEQTRGEAHAQVEQVRGEGQAQVEEARNEGRAQLELARSESQKHLELVQNESQSKLDEAQRQAQAELSQCQNQHQELSAQFEEQGTTHRRLVESAQELEQALKNQIENIKHEKAKLEKSLSDRDISLSKEKKSKKEVQKELKDVQKVLDDMIAAKRIITIDYDLLNEKVEEIKGEVSKLTNDFMGVVGEYMEVAKEKTLEFHGYVETEVYPKVKDTVERDVIPLARSTSKKAQDLFEENYAPHRPTVNKHMKLVRKESSKFYKQNLEPVVKEYELDVHAATAKKTAQEYATLAHNNLVKGIKTGSGVALNFMKLEEGPQFIINGLEKIHADHEKVALYIEYALGFIVAYYFLKMIFGGSKKRKGKKQRMTKQQYKEKVEKEAAAAKAKQQQPKNNKAKNGHKNNKKNK